MKKRVIKFLSIALCLVFCLQVFLGTGLFTLRVDAAGLTVPNASGNGLYYIKDLRSAAFPHGNYVTCFSNVNASDAAHYASRMVSAGYTQVKTGTVNNVTYWHYTHPQGVAYLVFNGSTMYVTTDDRTVTSAYTPVTNYKKITETTLGIMSLDYSHGELGDGNGLCNIWTLEDGSYLIIDGGYTYDSQRLYNYLYDNNKREDGAIVIHAWYFTHGDGDHIGAFLDFTNNHTEHVILENVIANASWDADPLNSTLLNKMKEYPEAKLIRPHTGETFQFPGLRMDMLYTPEDLYVYDGTTGSANEASIVSRVTVGGQTILYTGDASTKACAKMISMYGTGLHSDFLQINHHGYSGGTQAFFQNVTPSYVLWTSSQFGAEQRSAGKMYQWIGSQTYVDANRWLFNSVGGDYDRIFAADGAVEQMTFPYNGDRDSLATYRAHDTWYNGAPELIITELAPHGYNKSGWTEFIEIYNNSDRELNVYDFCVVKDSNCFSAGNLKQADSIWYMYPDTHTFQSVNIPENTVTHTNPSRDEGWLEPGEVALIWIPTNTMWNVETTNATNKYTHADFRSYLNLTADQKSFVAYNNYATSLNNSGSYMFAIGYANKKYDGIPDNSYGAFVSYTFMNSGADAWTPDGIFVPTQTMNDLGSIRYEYGIGNRLHGGNFYVAESGVSNPVKLDSVQKRDRGYTIVLNGVTMTLGTSILDLTKYLDDENSTVTAIRTYADGSVKQSSAKKFTVSSGMKVDFYENGKYGKVNFFSQDFDNVTIAAHTFSDSSDTTYKQHTFKYERLLGIDQMTPTDGSQIEVTADGKLRLYNPYYMEYNKSSYSTKNYDFQIELGDFSEMVGNRFVLEYDFQYNDKGTEATAGAVFSFGKHVEYSRYCFAPALTVQGFYQPRIGTAYGGATLHSQIRPEWIPYTVKNTGYNYPYGGVTNHYNIYGGMNHVKIEVDPYNGITTYINGVAISMVQDVAAWQELYEKNMGQILGLSINPGVEVLLDNIRVYADNNAPELLITEVGNAMGVYEYIEVYNNSDRNLDIYNYQLMRNTNLASGGTDGYKGVGTKDGAPIRWTKNNIATIKKGTHTYTAEASGQSVTLTNPDSGIIKPGETAILWIPSNTTYDDTTSTSGDKETLEMFMENYGLTDASKIFAAYNNNNISLWDGGDIAYGIGYADVNYTTHNAYALNELVSYVYMNSAATSIYGLTETVTKAAAAYASVEFKYAENNIMKRGTFLSSTANTNSIGKALDAQERLYDLKIGTGTFRVPLSIRRDSLMSELELTTLYGASIRTSALTGMRWMTSLDADAYAKIKKLESLGAITNIEIGTILTRTADMTGKTLTLNKVDGVKVHKVTATDTAWFVENPTVEEGYDASLVGTHIFAGSVVSIYKENYNVKYSAVGYVRVTFVDGTVETVYGGYNADSHSRTVAEVAYKALNDQNNGLSAAELAIIAGFAACYEG